jgi:RimJ/RimL family protein N-acetyltransferase
VAPSRPVGYNTGMLRGDTVGLRARIEADVPVLHAELYDDVATRSRADSRPWRPLNPAASPYAVGEPGGDAAVFSVIRLADGELAGEALLWGIDPHNRSAHLGISLRPALRGQRYGFLVRGLHRLQLETLADNAAMVRAATGAGFTPEGTLRRAAWVSGAFLDEVIFGLLADEWQPDHG